MCKFKYVKILVLLLFAATSVISGVVPLLTFQGAAHYCDGNSCSVMCEGNCKCSLNHHKPDNKNSHLKICGCTQGADIPAVLSENVRAKAVVVNSSDFMLLLLDKVYVFLKEKETNIFVKEIFHPPRLSA